MGVPRPLGAAADQAAFRILQEALTNAARHGAGAARIELKYGDTVLDIIITNPVLPRVSPPSGPRHGLIGMRERVALYGGKLHTGPEPRGGYGVRARLPVDPDGP
jgi:signal transduction histidine kinase